MSDYSESVERLIEHLDDDPHAAAYLGTLEPADDGGSDFEVLAAVDRSQIDSGQARLELLAHHVLVLSDVTDRSPREIAGAIVGVIEESERFEAHNVEPADEE